MIELNKLKHPDNYYYLDKKVNLLEKCERYDEAIKWLVYIYIFIYIYSYD